MSIDLARPAGTNPIHNKKPKKVAKEEDEDDKAHKAKLQAGMANRPVVQYAQELTVLTVGLTQTRRLGTKWPRRLQEKVL